MHHATSLYGMFAESGGSNILASLGTFVVSVGTLLGIWLSRKQSPATVQLSIAQARKTDAETEKILAERDEVRERSAGTALQTVTNSLVVVSRELDATRAKLVTAIDERDDWKRRAEIAEAATKLSVQQAQAEHARRKWPDEDSNG